MAVSAARRPRAPSVTPAQLARYFEAKLAAEVGPHDLKRILDGHSNRVVVLDVRSRQGYAEHHLPGAVNIPLEELAARARELPRDKDIIAYCWNVTCLLCTKAAALLAAKGYRAKELLGGIQSWQEAGFPTER